MALRSELEENPLAPPIEEDFLNAKLKYGDSFESEEDFQEAFDVWPRCPQCGRRRIARCPVCHTSADLFPLGDRDFWNAQECEEHECSCGEGCSCGHDHDGKHECSCDRSHDGEHKCSCGHCHDGEHECSCGHSHDGEHECSCGHCHDGGRQCSRHNRHDDALYDESETAATLDGQLMPGVPSPRRMCKCQEKTSDVFDDLSDKRERVTSWSGVDKRRLGDQEGQARENATVAICGVCSEAFTPQFPKRCEWCGYEFEDGVEEDVFDPANDENGVAEFVARHEAAPDDADVGDSNRLMLAIGVMAAVGIVLAWLFCRAM